jgi:hypothetical protein
MLDDALRWDWDTNNEIKCHNGELTEFQTIIVYGKMERKRNSTHTHTDTRKLIQIMFSTQKRRTHNITQLNVAYYAAYARPFREKNLQIYPRHRNPSLVLETQAPNNNNEK